MIDFNSFQGIACEGQTHTQTQLSSLKLALQTKRHASQPTKPTYIGYLGSSVPVDYCGEVFGAAVAVLA